MRCLLALALLVVAAAALPHTLAPIRRQNEFPRFADARAATQPICSGTPGKLTLYCGQKIVCGEATLQNTEDDIIVTVKLTDGWATKLIHYNVDCKPPASSAPGRFASRIEVNAFDTTFTITVPWSTALGSCPVLHCGKDSVVVALHLEANKLNSTGGVVQSETGWLACPQAPCTKFGRGWGGYFNYTLCCPDDLVVPDGCTLTQGYWKTHTGGKLDPLWNDTRLADRKLCGKTWKQVFDDQKGEGSTNWYALARQLMAAGMNLLNNTNNDCTTGGKKISELIAEGEQLLNSNCDTACSNKKDEKPCEFSTDGERTRANQLASTLDAFNNGCLDGCNPHCGGYGKTLDGAERTREEACGAAGTA
jgi:hypothetical protein